MLLALFRYLLPPLGSLFSADKCHQICSLGTMLCTAIHLGHRNVLHLCRSRDLSLDLSDAQLGLEISENLDFFSESWKPCTNLRNELCTVDGMQRWETNPFFPLE